jgi:hypothetical protein
MKRNVRPDTPAHNKSINIQQHDKLNQSRHARKMAAQDRQKILCG